MREKQGTSLMLLLLYALLITALLVLVVAGARLYGSALDASRSHSDHRRALSYLQSQMAACEGSGSAVLAAGPQGDMLVLRDPDTGYETRIYQYDGCLRSEFTRADFPADPENSEVVCPLEQFSLRLSEGVLYMTADGYTAAQVMNGGGSHE